MTRVLIVGMLSLCLYACGVSESEMSARIRQDLQTEVDTDGTLRDHHLQVLRVELIKSGSNTFDGFAIIGFRGVEEKVALKVTRDGKRFMFKTEPMAFAFVAEAGVGDAIAAARSAAQPGGEQFDAEFFANLQFKSVDTVKGTPEGTAAAETLGLDYPASFFRPYIDREGNVYINSSLVPGDLSRSLAYRFAKDAASRDWRIMASNDVSMDHVFGLLMALQTLGVSEVAFTEAADKYQPPRVELGLQCEREYLPKATREICMDSELQAKLYKEKGCCLVPDPNPTESASPPVTLAGTSFSEEGMPVWEVDFDGTVLHQGATISGAATVVAALQDSRGKSIVVRPSKRVDYRYVAEVFKAAKDLGVQRIYIAEHVSVSEHLQVPEIDKGAAKRIKLNSNSMVAVENRGRLSTIEDSPQSAASDGLSVGGANETSDVESDVQRDDKVALVITPPSTQGPGARITQPEYPAASRRARQAGVVVLRAFVLEDGRPGDVQVEKTSGFPALDESAVREVQREWRFDPGTKDGVPAPMWASFAVTFAISE